LINQFIFHVFSVISTAKNSGIHLSYRLLRGDRRRSMGRLDHFKDSSKFHLSPRNGVRVDVGVKVRFSVELLLTVGIYFAATGGSISAWSLRPVLPYSSPIAPAWTLVFECIPLSEWEISLIFLINFVLFPFIKI
jgi:hypothetical protein